MQQELVDAIESTGKPFAVVLFNGRPLTLGNAVASSPAMLEAWFPSWRSGRQPRTPRGHAPGLRPELLCQRSVPSR